MNRNQKTLAWVATVSLVFVYLSLVTLVVLGVVATAKQVL